MNRLFRFAFPMRAAVLAAALHAATGAHAADATVTLRLDEAGPPVLKTVLAGHNVGNWMPLVEHREVLGPVAAGALRFPAGNAGDDTDLDAAALDPFAAMLPLLPGKAELMLQTRVFQGRDGRPAANGPDDAARGVRLALERGLQVTYWEIGNEPDLYGPVRGDTTWTPERYCKVAREQAAAVRKEQPGALISGPAVSGSMPSAMHFLEAFVAQCGDVIDLLTWHIYPTAGDGSDEAALASVSEVDGSLRRYQALWKDPVRNPLGHQRHIRFGVTEYGLSWRTESPRFLADQTAALWATESALRLARNGASVAHYFAYAATGFHGLIDVGGIPRPTYYGFDVLGRLKGRFIGASSDHANLWSHAVRDGDEVQVVLINTRKQALPARLSLPGAKVRDARYFDARIAEAGDPMGRLKPRSRLVLPARSVTLVTLSVPR